MKCCTIGFESVQANFKSLCIGQGDRGRGVTRLDGVRGKKQIWQPMFEPEVLRKQMYCIEESTCDIVGSYVHTNSGQCTKQHTQRREDGVFLR